MWAGLSVVRIESGCEDAAQSKHALNVASAGATSQEQTACSSRRERPFLLLTGLRRRHTAVAMKVGNQYLCGPWARTQRVGQERALLVLSLNG